MKETKDPFREDPQAEKHFLQEWRQWLDRPMQRNARAASDRVLDRIRTGPPAIQLWIPAGAVTALLLLSLVLFRTPTVENPQPKENKAFLGLGNTSATLTGGEVLMWIDEKTPLYMTFQLPEE